METYISILRGVNVGGQAQIKMEALKKSYEKLYLSNVATYIQSGNVIFDAGETDTRIIENRICSQIEADFGVKVPVIVLTWGSLKKIIEENPFTKDPGKDLTFLHVTFLAETPKQYDKESIEDKKQGDEEIRFSEKAIYLYCPHGYGRTKLNNNFLEKKLKVGATTRNWKPRWSCCGWLADWFRMSPLQGSGKMIT
ncbi:MAG: hypothetical protein ABS46_02385 [Cytophagaceae bacterium SCN 52-12]|nr:MAG: hypothetical protein ABS46_02385 [Cytophagaceae bacterium SCN 52-12]